MFDIYLVEIDVEWKDTNFNQNTVRFGKGGGTSKKATWE